MTNHRLHWDSLKMFNRRMHVTLTVVGVMFVLRLCQAQETSAWCLMGPEERSTNVGCCSNGSCIGCGSHARCDDLFESRSSTCSAGSECCNASTGVCLQSCCLDTHGHSGFRFKLTEFNNYTTFSYLDDLSGTFNELEFTSETTFGNIHMENHTILNIADLPSTISLGPTNPSGDVSSVGVRANGFGDILTAFFFSRRNVERNFELGIGPVITLPSATDDILGARQWTVGPGAHFSTEIDRLTAGFFVWQSWKVGGSSASTRTNQLFGKPFFLYELNEKWQLIYIPLGLSHSWEKKSGENWTVPLGGGLRRRFQIHDQKMGLQAQVFDYVAQKKGDPDWEFRMTVEFLFD